MRIKLFYSYCHDDEHLRDKMQNSISILKTNGLIAEWYDRKIIPGNKWKSSILKELEVSEIVVFLITPNFLNSDACREEWFLAKGMAEQKSKQLVSIILRECAWTDFDEMSEFQALPKDGKAVESWDNIDNAWLDVCKGLKRTVEFYYTNFKVKKEFVDSISQLEFCSQSDENIKIQDLFVFPNIVKETGEYGQTKNIKDTEELLDLKKVLIVGDEQSGKSKLCVHIFLNLVNSDITSIFLDLQDVLHKKPSKELYKNIINNQVSGDIEEWLKIKDKVLVVDNLINHKNISYHFEFLSEYFDSIIIAVNKDVYDAYFIDDERFIKFEKIEIKPLGLTQQETLIRNWFSLNGDGEELHDGKIDEIENNINEIIINNKILPRYPFFILSILQTYEAFMPKDVKITAYGHCYYALILATLIKSGVDKRDDAIISCMNFCSQLAYYIYINGGDGKISVGGFNEFKSEYTNNFIIEDSNINRMLSEKGILKTLNGDGYAFNLPYSYYFFLGKYIAKNYKENLDLINGLVSHSYRGNNAIIIIFTIHHSTDSNLIEDILTHTLCALDSYEPAKLDKSETDILLDFMKLIPKRVLSDKSVAEERARERKSLERQQSIQDDNGTPPESETHEEISQIYLAHKNIEILSQILKNKYGELNKKGVKELIEVICDAGLRMIKVPLVDEEQLTDIVNYIYKSMDETHKSGFKSESELLSEVRKAVIYRMFVWAIGNVEKIVSAINKREIKDLIKELRDERDTPAYDLIHYFYSLDSAYNTDEHKKKLLEEILDKYEEDEMFFIHRILSARTQHYFNTHNVHAPIKQAVSSLLGIEYKPG